MCAGNLWQTRGLRVSGIVTSEEKIHMLLLTLAVPDVAVDPRIAADSALCDEAKVLTVNIVLILKRTLGLRFIKVETSYMIVFAETRDKVGMLEVPEGCLDNRPLYWVNESGMEAYHLVQREAPHSLWELSCWSLSLAMR